MKEIRRAVQRRIHTREEKRSASRMMDSWPERLSWMAAIRIDTIRWRWGNNDRGDEGESWERRRRISAKRQSKNQPESHPCWD